MKQTAVEYLLEEFSAIIGRVNFTVTQDLFIIDAVIKAKEMEKDQHEMTFNEALDEYSNRSFEEYYNETYKNETK
jgi:hypothetical protein